MTDKPIGFRDALGQLHSSLAPRRKRQFYGVLVLMLAAALAEVAVVGSVVPFLSLLSGNPGPGFLGGIADGIDPERRIAVLSLLFMAAVLVASAIRLQLAWSNQSFVTGVGHDLAVEIQRRILLQPYPFHTQRSTSESIATLDKIQVLVFGVLQQAMLTAVAAVMGLFILALLFSIDALVAVAAFASLALFYLLISRLAAARLARNSAILGTAYDQRVRIIQESLGGIRDLIIDRTQPLYLDEFRKVDGRFARAEAATMFIASAPRYLIEAVALVLIAGLAIVLAGRDGGLDRALPVLGALALAGLRLLPLLQQAFAGWATMAANRSVIGQVLDLLRLPVSDLKGPAPAPLCFERSVELDGISFTYPGRNSPALDGVSLTIPRGSRVALVGRTGSGKSTLADIVMGLIEPNGGRISIDGEPLASRRVSAWQASIAHVPQSIFLADASIARNIGFSVAEAAIDMDRVREAARVAELIDFIDSLPDGFDTRVGERGVRLSGGQRQRLGIARALYKQAPLLILDEATNALDRDTEATVLGNLMAVKDRTMLIIAHRESTIEGCDQVIRLQKGRIV